MKQVTIYANSDLEPRVVNVLDHARVEGFMRIGEATGSRFVPGDEVPRTMSWQSVMFVVPAATDEQLGTIGRELAAFAGECGVEPCLRIVATPVESVYPPG